MNARHLLAIAALAGLAALGWITLRDDAEGPDAVTVAPTQQSDTTASNTAPRLATEDARDEPGAARRTTIGDPEPIAPARHSVGWPSLIEVVDETGAILDDAELWIAEPGDAPFALVPIEVPVGDVSLEHDAIGALARDGYCVRFFSVGELAAARHGSSDESRTAPLRTVLPRAARVLVDMERDDDGEVSHFPDTWLQLQPVGASEMQVELVLGLRTALDAARAAGADFRGRALELRFRTRFAALVAEGALGLKTSYAPALHASARVRLELPPSGSRSRDPLGSGAGQDGEGASLVPFVLEVAPSGVTLAGTFELDPTSAQLRPMALLMANGALRSDGTLPELVPTIAEPATLLFTANGWSAVRFRLPPGTERTAGRTGVAPLDESMRAPKRHAHPVGKSTNPFIGSYLTFGFGDLGDEPGQMVVPHLVTGRYELFATWKDSATGEQFSHRSEFEIGVEEFLDLGTLTASLDDTRLVVRFDVRFGDAVSASDRERFLTSAVASMIIGAAPTAGEDARDHHFQPTTPLGTPLEIPGFAAIPSVLFVHELRVRGRSAERTFAEGHAMLLLERLFEFTVDGVHEIVVPVEIDRTVPVALTVAAPPGVTIHPTIHAVRESDGAQFDVRIATPDRDGFEPGAMVEAEVGLAPGTWRVFSFGVREVIDASDGSHRRSSFVGHSEVSVAAGSGTADAPAVTIELVETTWVNVHCTSSDAELAARIENDAMSSRFARPVGWSGEIGLVGGDGYRDESGLIQVEGLLPNTEYELNADGTRFVTGPPGSVLELSR